MTLDPITAIANVVGSAIDKIWPDKTEAEKGKLALLLQEMTLNVQPVLKQIEVNIEEAKHQSLFVSGWRPFIGWVCGSALAYYYILQPLLVWLFSIWEIQTRMPRLDSGDLMTILLGMLGLGAFRTYEKTKNGSGGNG
jgi:hypothetical protein